MEREGEAVFRRELGISLAQFLVLSVVDAHPGPLSQQAVADRVGLTKGSVSRQIDQAVAAGLMTVRARRGCSGPCNHELARLLTAHSAGTRLAFP